MNKFLASLFGVCLLLANVCKAEVVEPQYVDGHSFYIGKTTSDGTALKLELLKGAKKTIDMSCGYAGGEIFQKLHDILLMQLETNPEIQIHLIVSQNAGVFSKAEQKLLAELQKKFPNNFKYIITDFSALIQQEDGLYTTENHMKLLIVDEKYFQLGGTNLVDNLCRSEYDNDYSPDTLQQAFLPKASSDLDVVGSGPMAKKLREEFYMIWELYKTKGSVRNNAGPLKFAKTEYTPLPEEGRAVVEAFENSPDVVRDVKAFALVSGPRFQYHAIGDYLLYYIQHAQSSIDIAHMYFFPVERIYKPMIEATKRNVEFSVITNGIRLKPTTANSTIALYTYINRVNFLPVMLGRTFDFWQKDDAKKTPLKPTEIYEFNIPHMLYHKKVTVVDDRYSSVGSYNYGKKSENSDFEVNVFMDSPEVAKQLKAILEKDKEVSAHIGINDAIDWHFSFFYNIMSAFESFFFDGIILGIDDLPKQGDTKFNNLERTDFDWNKSDGVGF